MKPPQGMRIEHAPERDTEGMAGFDVTVVEIVHRCPPGSSNMMPCCGQTPFEVPRWHRMTLDAALVTCSGVSG